MIVLKFRTLKKKKGNNSKMGNGIYFRMVGKVDLGMLNMFAIKLNLYLL